MLTGVSINNVATYNEPTQLNNLKEINFIFGSNGSGKTTISRILEQAPGYTHCSLQWGGGLPLKTVVYNRDFIERNFNQANTVRGVFTLGDDQVEAERQITLLRPQIDKLTRDIQRLNGQLDGDGTSIGKKAELGALESNLQSKCWRQKQNHDSYFQEAFTGYRNNAERFKQRVLSERQSNNAELLTLEELKEKASTVFSEDVVRYNPITAFDASYLIQAESNEILQKVIVGNQDVNIAKLIERLGNSDWVKQGLAHYEKSSPNCPFCQQPTPLTFFDELNNFFSEIYDQEIKVIEDLSNQYMRVSNSLIITIEAISNHSNPFLQADLFHAESQTLKERTERNKSLLLKKLAEPSLKITLEPIEPIVTELLALISQANVSTSEHNQIVQNIDTEKRVLTSQVWKYILRELDNDLNEYEQQNFCLEAAINGMTESQRRKTQEIAELQRQIREYEQRSTSILPTVNDINSLLRSFGFTSFKIDPVDDQGHYKICRAKARYGTYITKHAIQEGINERDSENYIRELKGVARIGERWVNETLLFNYINLLFPQFTVQREASPSWLNKKRFDIYIPELNLAIEYQGKQHYVAVDLFGGEEGLKKTKQRDKEKLHLSKINCVDIIYFSYKENLTEKLVQNRLKNYLKEY